VPDQTFTEKYEMGLAVQAKIGTDKLALFVTRLHSSSPLVGRNQ
jgi:tetrahydromethanopterin S-methyltransferase subunit F